MSILTQGAQLRRGTCLGASAVTLLALIAPAAFAQDVQVAQATPAAPAAAPAKPAAKPAPKAQAEEVVVTGSRIRQPNLTSVSPLTVVSNQELKISGTLNVEDLVNSLPQVFANQGSSISNGSTGTATVDLRGLGPSRTLVLIDGKRLMPGSPLGSSADLNNIPEIALERVDVVTGGASATYGADAVSGVVNFIFKKNFEGVKVDGEFTFANHDQQNPLGIADIVRARGFKLPASSVNDAHTYKGSFMMGANSENGKGNITVFGEYRNLQPLTQSERDFSACSLSDNGDGTRSCGGSSTTDVGRIVVDGGASKIPTTAGTFIPYVAARDQFNFAPYNYYQRADDRYNVGFKGHYEISKQFDAYTDFLFTDDHTVAQIAPSGYFFGTPFTWNCDNPFISAQEKSFMASCLANPTSNYTTRIGRRLVEGGARQDDLRHTNYRIDVGLRGDINDTWNYDAYAQYGTTILSRVYLNDVSVIKANRALQVVNVKGVPTCKSVLDGSDPNCVPANIFALKGLSSAAAAYLATPGVETANATEQVVSGSLGGDLTKYGFKSPLADDGIRISLGAEYRREAAQVITDQEFQSGDLAGQGGPTLGTKGNFDVKEGFFEVKIPVIQSKPFIKDISIDGGYRYSDYSVSGTTDTWKAGLEYSPTADVRLRGSYNHAVRAPNIGELFVGQGLGLFSGNDPCAGPTPSASLAACQRTGVTAAQYKTIFQCSASQCNLLSGGNPNLTPELSDTKSFGFVYTPTYFEGFNASFDFFDIKVDGYIQAGLDSNLVINQCLITGNPFFCSQIHRDAGGSINSPTGYVQAFNLNSGSIETKGFDLTANYTHELPDWIKGGAGSLSVAYNGTILNDFIYEPIVGLGKFNCAGYYGTGGCGTPAPKYRHRMRLTWATPWDVDASLVWRHFAGTKFTGNTNDPFYGNTPSIVDATIPSYDYIDLSATWHWKYGLTFRGGVQNVGDKDPPIITSGNAGAGSFNNGNTYSQVYDVVGRRVFIGATFDY
jgi:outer membrane receptor protein involved in Fe transport